MALVPIYHVILYNFRLQWATALKISKIIVFDSLAHLKASVKTTYEITYIFQKKINVFWCQRCY